MSQARLGMNYATRQRSVILTILQRSERPLTVREIHERSGRDGAGIGLATVYRALKFFTEQGIVATVEIPGAAPCYEPADRGHHHHFLCQRCGRVFDLQGCVHEVDGLAPGGFQIQRHDIILYGLCAICAGS